MFRFDKYYFSIAVIIFMIEVLIALFIHDQWIRPYFGDVLVVILIYSFFKAFFDLPVTGLSLGVMLFAYTIEFLQYLKIVNHLGLEHSQLARTVIGTSFAWIDLLAYTIGIAIILFVEKYRIKTASV